MTKSLKGRPRTLTLSAINIAAVTDSKHNPQTYIDLFEKLAECRTLGKLTSDVVELDTMKRIDDAFYGQFIKYTIIDPKKKWYNSNTREDLLDENGKPKIPVQKGINPNKNEIIFFFDINRHILVYDVKAITSKQLVCVLRDAVENPDIRAIDAFNVHIIPEESSIDDLLAIPHLKRIKYSFTMPNPDLFSKDEENDLYSIMALNNAEVIRGEMIAGNRGELNPTDATKNTLKKAIKNGDGEVSVTGTDNNGAIFKKSTSGFPKIQKHRYNSLSSIIVELIHAAQSFIQDIK